MNLVWLILSCYAWFAGFGGVPCATGRACSLSRQEEEEEEAGRPLRP